MPSTTSPLSHHPGRGVALRPHLAAACIALLASAAALLPGPAAAGVITMLSIVQTDASGRPNGPIFFRTERLPAPVVPLYVAAGAAPALNAPFLNAQPGTQASLRLDLGAGLHTFTLFANQGTRMLDFASLQIAFDDRNDSPRIAAFAPFWTTQDSQPAFAANPVLAPGLVFDDGQRVVELMDFFFASGARYPGVDRVGEFGLGPDGRRDAIGQFSLRITERGSNAVPEPGSAALVLTAALAAVLTQRSRRTRQQGQPAAGQPRP